MPRRIRRRRTTGNNNYNDCASCFVMAFIKEPGTPALLPLWAWSWFPVPVSEPSCSASESYPLFPRARSRRMRFAYGTELGWPAHSLFYRGHDIWSAARCDSEDRRNWDVTELQDAPPPVGKISCALTLAPAYKAPALIYMTALATNRSRLTQSLASRQSWPLFLYLPAYLYLRTVGLQTP